MNGKWAILLQIVRMQMKGILKQVLQMGGILFDAGNIVRLCFETRLLF